MARFIPIDGQNGRCFDVETAERWDEARLGEKSGLESLATGSATEHERLYRTPEGTFIVQHWSDKPDTRTTYRVVSREEGYAWLRRSGYLGAVGS